MAKDYLGATRRADGVGRRRKSGRGIGYQPANITEMLKTPPLHVPAPPPKSKNSTPTNSPGTTRKPSWGFPGSLNTDITSPETRDIVLVSISTPAPPPPPTPASGLKNQHLNTPDSEPADPSFPSIGQLVTPLPPPSLSYTCPHLIQDLPQPLRTEAMTNSSPPHRLQSGDGKGGYEHEGGVVQLHLPLHRIRRPREL
ncbi:hypothetical protein Moror_9895 [Moniliophthora roreri MCA 2997]|uniref:Uncharacterized protein n=1 Tax=Moniliophthora roreri (strain MCA 2997) TaxID=1381753 RepID=V2WVU9_MONRO|nr:hypothetical protein Moror_9895 [Moniliophthora roreri MCA 2997]